MTVVSKNPYAILGVERNASEKDVVAAFRRLAKEYHPDVSKYKDGELFRTVTSAYKAICMLREKKAAPENHNHSDKFADTYEIDPAFSEALSNYDLYPTAESTAVLQSFCQNKLNRQTIIKEISPQSLAHENGHALRQALTAYPETQARLIDKLLPYHIKGLVFDSPLFGSYEHHLKGLLEIRKWSPDLAEHIANLIAENIKNTQNFNRASRNRIRLRIQGVPPELVVETARQPDKTWLSELFKTRTCGQG